MEKDSEVYLLWQDSSHNAAMNMAVDEALVELVDQWQQPILRLYEWNEPAISFGYVQKLDRVESNGEFLVRRITGGGIVKHQTQFTYTLVLPSNHFIYRDTKAVESYRIMNEAVKQALALAQVKADLTQKEIPKTVDRASMVCFTTPTRYDLVTEHEKVAGAAQRRTKTGLLHQGSIELVEALTSDLLRQILPKGFALSIPCDYEDFTTSQSDIVLSRARELCDEKYSQDSWNTMR